MRKNKSIKSIYENKCNNISSLPPTRHVSHKALVLVFWWIGFRMANADFLMSLTVLYIKTSKQNINIGVKLIFDKTQMLKMLPYSHIINFDVKHMKQKCLWSSTKYQIGVTKVTKDMWILIISWWNQKSYLWNIYSQIRFSKKHSYRMWFLE